MEKKQTRTLLFFILLLGLLLRVHDLDKESFWVDEGATAFVSVRSPGFLLENLYSEASIIPEYFGPGGGEMPFYYLLALFWTGLFGLSEFALRLPSVIFGMLAIYLTFFLGKLFFQERIGLLAAFIMAINHQHIFYAQEARNYTLIIFLTILSSYLFYAALKKNSTKEWCLYGCSAIILLYTHYLTVLILFFHYAYLLIYIKRFKDRFLKAFLAGIGMVIAYIPWLPVFIKQVFLLEYEYAYQYQPSIGKLAQVFVQMNSWISPDLPTRLALRNSEFAQVPLQGWILIGSILALTVVMGLLFLVGVFRDRKISLRNAFSQNKMFLLVWFVLPILIQLVFSVAYPSASLTGFISYVIFVTPAYYILVAKGLEELPSTFRTSLIIIIILFSLYPLSSFYTNYDKQQWKEAAAFLESEGSPGEIVIVNNPVTLVSLQFYHPLELARPVRTAKEGLDAVENLDSFWLLYASEKFTDPDHLIKKGFDTAYTLDKKHEVTGVKLFHYTKSS